MAAASHLTILTPKPRTIIRATATASCSNFNPTPAAAFKKQMMGVAAGFLAASVVAAAAPLEADATRIEYFATVAEPSCEFNFVRSGLGYCDIVVGSGEEVPFAELINVHYTARFADGIVFDSTYKRARPLTMRLGMGKVIKGLDQGILGGGDVPPMHVGGKRKLYIPPKLAYGPEPAGCFSGDCNIPGNATLIYDVNFVNIYSGVESAAVTGEEKDKVMVVGDGVDSVELTHRLRKKMGGAELLSVGDANINNEPLAAAAEPPVVGIVAPPYYGCPRYHHCEVREPACFNPCSIL